MIIKRLSLLPLLACLAVITACAGNPTPDTSQLSPTGQADFERYKMARGVNDVSSVVIGANQAQQLPDDATSAILTVNKQVLDVIEANPVGYKAKALSVFTNARDALPEAQKATLAKFLSQVSDVLNEVSK